MISELELHQVKNSFSFAELRSDEESIPRKGIGEANGKIMREGKMCRKVLLFFFLKIPIGESFDTLLWEIQDLVLTEAEPQFFLNRTKW